MKKIIAMIAVMAVLVITAVPIFAMETGSGSLSHLGIGDYAPADQGGSGT